MSETPDNYTKLKILLWPFILCMVGVAAGYTCINWCFFIQKNIGDFKEETINGVFPFLLSLIVAYLGLWRRIKILNLRQKKGNLRLIYVMVAAAGIAAPTICLQPYMEEATGKLTWLKTVSDIDKSELTKYYNIDSCYVYKNGANQYVWFYNTGGKSNTRYMNVAMAIPVLDKATDTLASTCKAWMGVQYNRVISNGLSQSEEDRMANLFAASCQEVFNNSDFKHFVYLESPFNSNEKENFIETITRNKMYNGQKKILLMPKFTPFESRFGDQLIWIFLSFGIAVVVWSVMVTTFMINTDELEKFENRAR